MNKASAFRRLEPMLIIGDPRRSHVDNRFQASCLLSSGLYFGYKAQPDGTVGIIPYRTYHLEGSVPGALYRYWFGRE